MSLQLGFAVIPLIHFVSDKSKMGEFVIPTYVKVLAWLSAIIIVGLNVKLVSEQIIQWHDLFGNTWWYNFLVIPIVILSGFMLLYITFKPLSKQVFHKTPFIPHGGFQEMDVNISSSYKRIAIAIDFREKDNVVLQNALAQGGKNATYFLIHVTETANAMFLGQETRDYESLIDTENLAKYKAKLNSLGYKVEVGIGYGRPHKEIVRLVKEFDADLLVMQAHGHRAFKDILLGSTIDKVRHNLSVPILIIR